jgi:antitoxin HicB
MNDFDYAVLLSPDEDGGYVVTCRDLPEVITQGETIEHALSEARDALDESFALRIGDNLDFPKPTKSLKGEYLVSPPVETQIKALLYRTLRETRTSKTELAKRLQVNEKSVRRMFEPHYKVKVQGMSRALEALGKRLVISVE